PDQSLRPNRRENSISFPENSVLNNSATNRPNGRPSDEEVNVALKPERPETTFKTGPGMKIFSVTSRGPAP
ncbi:MAG: hypothetical protein AAF362_14650, partial [Pseudomonadota bacterium]